VQNQDKITHINTVFYNSIAEGFARSRQLPWAGWNKLIKYLKNDITLADLGCGNGRFYGFLSEQNIEFKYEGYDNSTNLVKLAKSSYPNVSFFERDVIKEGVPTNYDVISMFGLVHHIKNIDSLNIFIKNLLPKINPGGYMFITFWQFDPFKERTFNEKARELGVTLESNDYLLDWGGSGKDIRFCHRYTQEEIGQFKLFLTNNKYILVDEFGEDKENLYLVFRNQN